MEKGWGNRRGSGGGGGLRGAGGGARGPGAVGQLVTA